MTILPFSLYASVSLVESVALWLLFYRLLPRRFVDLKADWCAYALYFAASLCAALLFKGTLANLAVSLCAPVVIALAVYQGSKRYRVLIAVLSIAYHFIAKPISISIVTFVMGRVLPELPSHDLYHFIAVGISAALYFAMLFLLAFGHRPTYHHADARNQLLLLVMVILCFLLAFADVIEITGSGTEMTVVQFVSELALGAMSVYVYYVFEQFQASSVQQMHNRVLQGQVSVMTEQLKIIDAHDKAMRMLKHDFGNHMQTMQQLISDKKFEELEEFAESLSEQIMQTIGGRITGVAAIDAIIAVKKSAAEQQRTQFIIHSECMARIVINPADLNVVICNALDNALEACAKLPDTDERLIEMTINAENEYVYISVSNTTAPVQLSQGGLPRSSKQNKDLHGYGMESMRHMIVDTYAGIFDYEAANSKFEVRWRMKNVPTPPHRS
jgi:sensor histidine kinase YesM